ncbi:hypothetical protein H8959_016751 [Pygathrix nigripes]
MIPFQVKEADGSQPCFQGVTGLRNLGNTCYMNAILQCLCSISPLVEYFLSGKYITALQNDCSKVATAFAYLMTDMWLGDSDCVSPEIFRSALGNLYPAFTKKTQQDAQEFLIFVLNELHEALKKYHYPRRRSHDKGSAQRCCRKWITTETSVITQLFEGQLNYSIVCLKCEKCTYKNEVFTVLSLPIPSEYECSLQDCLQCFFQQDTLTWNNQIHCSFCETKQETAVRAGISKAPKIIIFHLKRFDIQERVFFKMMEYFRHKNLNGISTSRTEFKQNVTSTLTALSTCLRTRIHPKFTNCIWLLYLLVIADNQVLICDSFTIHSILETILADLSIHEMFDNRYTKQVMLIDEKLKLRKNHFGDLDGGHYTAFCKNSFTQAWYSFDDTRVSEIPDTSVQNATAYLLFYSCQPFSIPIQKH